MSSNGVGSVTPDQTPSSLALASRIAELADDKKAQDIVVLDMRGLTSFTDFFVIATGGSDRQVRAIHDGIREGLKHDPGHIVPVRAEGEQESRWILLDYGDCVVHVMTAEAREFYRLEQLWADAERVKLSGIMAE